MLIGEEKCNAEEDDDEGGGRTVNGNADDCPQIGVEFKGTIHSMYLVRLR